MSSKYKQQIERLEKEKFKLTNEVAQLSEKLAKKTVDCQKKDEKIKETHKILNGFTEEIKNFQQR